MFIKLQTLGPVHIGSGITISPLEYIINDTFTRIDLDSLKKASDFESFRKKFEDNADNRQYIANLLPYNLLHKHHLYTLSIQEDANEYLKSNKTGVKSFVKSIDQVYIPGISIKNCILSALLWFTLTNAHGRDRENIELILLNQGNFYNLLQIAIKRMLSRQGVQNFGNARFINIIDVNDSNTFDVEKVLEVALVYNQGVDEDFLLYETLKPGTEFTLRISTNYIAYSISDIFYICNQFSHRVLQNEAAVDIQYTEKLLSLGHGYATFDTSLQLIAQDFGITGLLVQLPSFQKRSDDYFLTGLIELSKVKNDY